MIVRGTFGAKLKQCRVFLVCIVLAIVVFIGNMVVSRVVYSKNLNALDDEIQQLTTNIEVNRVSRQESLDSAKAKVVGLDTKRVKTDDGVLESFLKKCFTWSSAAEYRAIRKELENSDVIDSSGTFVDVLFPELTEDLSVDGDRTKNTIDDSIYGKLNLKYDSLQSHVISVDGTNYRYFTEVTVTSSIDGGVSKTGLVVMTYTVDKDGNLSDVDAYTVAN